MLARTLEGRIVLTRRTGLRDVRNLVPHDRVDYLEPLSRDGLQRFAVRHAPVAAARVIFAPSVAAASKAVAREYEQVLQPLVALPRRGHRRYRRAGPPVARCEPAARGEPVVAREVGYVYGYGQLECRSRPYAGHREQAPVRLVGGERRRYLGGQRLDLGGVLRYPSREQPDGAVLAGDGY